MNINVQNMSPFIVMDVLDRANDMQLSGIDVIHLEVGEPDFQMPECARKAAQDSLSAGNTHYTHSLGSPVLRSEIAELYRREYGDATSGEQEDLTSGSWPAVLLELMLLCKAGDEVILSNPGYACYKNFVLACGATPVFVPLSADNGFQFSISELRKSITPRTKAIVINSPMNPTGTLLEPDVMKDIASLGVTVISDEIYHGLVYGCRPHSILEFTDNAIVVNGFSKRFAMTGLRLGYLIAPQQYMRALLTLQQNLFICAPSIAQDAALAVLRNGADDCEQMRKTYDERRLFLLERLRSIGFEIATEPKGAFYIFADARRFTSDSYRFAFDVLENAHIGITPGVDFGTLGEGFVRFSYANSIENISRAMTRLQSYLAR